MAQYQQIWYEISLIYQGNIECIEHGKRQVATAGYSGCVSPW